MSSKIRTLQRQQARKGNAGQEKTEQKKFSRAEREELAETNAQYQEAYTRQAKFVNFLRKQHDAPEAEGWVPTLEGFIKQQEAEAGPDESGFEDDGFEDEDEAEDE